MLPTYKQLVKPNTGLAVTTFTYFDMFHLNHLEIIHITINTL